jgi:hypothetical protein
MKTDPPWQQDEDKKAQHLVKHWQRFDTTLTVRLITLRERFSSEQRSGHVVVAGKSNVAVLAGQPSKPAMSVPERNPVHA